jgi:hypothetical protein
MRRLPGDWVSSQTKQAAIADSLEFRHKTSSNRQKNKTRNLVLSPACHCKAGLRLRLRILDIGAQDARHGVWGAPPARPSRLVSSTSTSMGGFFPCWGCDLGYWQLAGAAAGMWAHKPRPRPHRPPRPPATSSWVTTAAVAAPWSCPLVAGGAGLAPNPRLAWFLTRSDSPFS